MPAVSRAILRLNAVLQGFSLSLLVFGHERMKCFVKRERQCMALLDFDVIVDATYRNV
ncbi:hypothetical protein Bra5_PD00791 (plasmid) [Rhizobium phaseoli Brasil 5]|nr:hypothetical protein Bra5_PD00791 [Rhizobium phaseoli Brasil 5]